MITFCPQNISPNSWGEIILIISHQTTLDKCAEQTIIPSSVFCYPSSLAKNKSKCQNPKYLILYLLMFLSVFMFVWLYICMFVCLKVCKSPSGPRGWWWFLVKTRFLMKTRLKVKTCFWWTHAFRWKNVFFVKKRFLVKTWFLNKTFFFYKTWFLVNT